jgi:multimeric flavodoxin WrbA
MRVAIIEAGEESGRLFAYANTIEAELSEMSVDARLFSLRSLSVKPCLGCFSCMFRTPGVCVRGDDGDMLLREFLAADRVLFLYPLCRGFMGPMAKDFVDRLFPLELPYIEFRDGAMTHMMRYDRYPELGFVVGLEEGGMKAEFEIAAELNRRLACSYRSSIFINAEDSIEPKEVAHAIVHD